MSKQQLYVNSTYVVIANIPKEKVKQEGNVNTHLFANVSTTALHGISGNCSIVKSLIGTVRTVKEKQYFNMKEVRA